MEFQLTGRSDRYFHAPSAGLENRQNSRVGAYFSLFMTLFLAILRKEDYNKTESVFLLRKTQFCTSERNGHSYG